MTARKAARILVARRVRVLHSRPVRSATVPKVAPILAELLVGVAT
jgi:hypothetical protein